MKPILLIFISLCLAFNFSKAQDTLYMYQKNGEVLSFPINEIDSITFIKPPVITPEPCSPRAIYFSANNYSFSNFDVCRTVNKEDPDTLYLDLIADTENLRYIYITKSEDNSTPVPFTGPQLTDYSGIVLTPGSGTSYSYKTGSDAEQVTGVSVNIPIPKRTTPPALNTVYTVWFTSAPGSFSSPGKNTLGGPYTFSVNYSGQTAYQTVDRLRIGDQFNISPSYVAVSGLIREVWGTDLGELNFSREQKENTLNQIAFCMASLTHDGSMRGSVPHLLSLNQRASVGFTANVESTATTKFAAYTRKTFDLITGSDLKSLPDPVSSRIMIEAGKLYAFVTQDGRKGVVRIDELILPADTGDGYAAVISVKVAAQ